MQKIKKIIILLTLIFTLTFPIVVKAEDEIEEEFDFTGIGELLQSVTSEANKIPNINSRHAVIYDRATR
ncbi:MAG: hypothetical protein HFJ52_06040 [Clostridia bacterium]|nr:hypothetical protein [Clostridia bacterium]